MEKVITANLKFLYLPLLAILTIIILFLVSFKFFNDRLSSQNSELTKLQGQQIVLSQKLSALEHVGDLANNVQDISFALPGENPSFIEVSQIKRYIQQQGLILTSIQIGQESSDAQGMMYANVNFDVEGNPIAMLNLIDKLKNAAPLTIGNNISINQKGGTTLSTFTISVYWSAFPEKLPALTEPVSELSPADGETLSKVSALDIPVLGSLTTTPTATQGAIPTGPKTNPFGF